MTEIAPATVPPAGLSRNRAYQRVWFAGAISGLGDVVFSTACVVWVGAIIAGGRAWAPLAVSGVLFAEMIPAVLLGPVGGVYADRWDRRRIMLTTDLLRALVIGLLILLPAFGHSLPIGAKLAVVYLAVAAESGVAQFFRPARFAVFGTVIADQDRERAGSIAQGTDAIITILGPSLAAPLVIVFANGVHWALAINALSFLVSYVAVLGVRLPVDPDSGPPEERPKGSMREDMRAGLRFVLGSRTMRVIVTAVVLVTFGVSTVNVLDLFFVTGNLHVSVGYYGLLDAAIGAGIVVGSIAFAVIGSRIRASRVFSVGLLLCGVGIVGYSRSTMVWVAVVVLFLLGIPLAGVNSMIGPMVFREVPRDLMGRVLGLLNPVQQIASASSILLSTWLASTVLHSLDAHALGLRFGPVDTIFLGAGLLVVVVGIWAIGAARSIGTPAAAEPAAEGGEPAAEGDEQAPVVDLPPLPTVDAIDKVNTEPTEIQ